MAEVEHDQHKREEADRRAKRKVRQGGRSRSRMSWTKRG